MTKKQIFLRCAFIAAAAVTLAGPLGEASAQIRRPPPDSGSISRFPRDRAITAPQQVEQPPGPAIICGEPKRSDMPDRTIGLESGAPDGATAAAAAVPPRRRVPRRPIVGDRPGIAEGCAKRRVHSAAELEDVLRSDFTGCVIIPRGAFFNMSGRTNIPINPGVSLIGERGDLCGRPTIYTDTERTERYALFTITGNNVRVSGLHLRGPAKGDRTHITKDRPYVHGIQIIVDPDTQQGRGIVIADNEFNEWLGAGVRVLSTHTAYSFDEYLPEWAYLTRADAGQIRIERNFMHHNAADGGGYGVVVDRGAYALIEGNVFDFNRHAVASDGLAHTGYIARHNYVQEGGFKQEGFYNQHFDVHGTKFKDGKNTGYGAMAGTYYEIAFNTFRGAQTYYAVKTRPAFLLRGKPTEGAHFFGNVLVHDDLDSAVSLKMSKSDSGIGEDHNAFNFKAYSNTFNTDRSGSLGTGHFDGDGRTDVFLATGTAWFFSRAGSEPWEFLRASTQGIENLGFADIDNDRVTDVLLREQSGDIIFFKSGRLDPVRLTTSPIAMKDMRFGDFDGDDLTDIFRSVNGQWQVWYGRSRAWTAAANSGFPIGAFLFGEFDDTKGTDVVAITGGMWAYSSGATGRWTRLNDKLVPNFNYAVVADFDGDGRTDIAFSSEERQSWYYSPGGRAPFRTLREADGMVPYPMLDRLLVGRFEGDPRPEVLSYYRPIGSYGGELANHFVIWREGVRVDFAKYSRVAMR